MRRRVRIENARTLDPVSLEINAQEALRLPLGQIDPVTIADFVALADAEWVPKSLRRGLEAFSARAARELSDLPELELKEILDLLELLPPEKAPGNLRAMLREELSRETRPELLRRAGRGLLERWEGTEPEEIVPPSSRARIQRADAAREPAPERPRTGIPRERAEKPPAAPKTKTPAVKPSADIERDRWIRNAALERLAMSLESGLAEQVLLAGLRHRARADFPDLTPAQIMAQLRELSNQGLVRHSAGRWRRIGS